MGFLDNSGDIILDAVLTDVGRKRLADSEPNSFTITQFALGDDEINYGLYNSSHSSGSAYYDLEIIQTPVLESFTNNASSMKSTLMTFSNNEILYLPVTLMNTDVAGTETHSESIHLVAVDENTQGNDTTSGDSTSIGQNGSRNGVLFGFDPAASNRLIRVDQGINNEEYTLDLQANNLMETSYIIQIDGKFGRIVDANGNEPSEKTTDDDGICYYTVSFSEELSNLPGNAQIVSKIGAETSPLLGSKGTKVQFKVRADQNLSTNYSRFNRYGFTRTINGNSTSCIDAIVRVTGVNFGYSVDIPIRYVKHN